MKYSIAELRALEKVATPGPWRCEQDWTWELFGGNDALIGKIIQAASRGFDHANDASLIVAARNALPDLLDLLEEAERMAQYYASLDPLAIQHWDMTAKALAFLDKLKKATR